MNECRKPIYIDRTLLTSHAFLELTGRAPQTLLIFYGKRQVEKLKRPGPHGEQYRVTNGRRLEFTFLEALHKYGMSAKVFGHALNELVEHGFLDIAKQGGGLNRDKTLFALSDRWRRYGTVDFEHKERPKGRAWTLPRKTETTSLEGRCSTSIKGRCERSSTSLEGRYGLHTPPALNVPEGTCSIDYHAVQSNPRTKPDAAQRSAAARRAEGVAMGSEASAAQPPIPVVKP